MNGAGAERTRGRAPFVRVAAWSLALLLAWWAGDRAARVTVEREWAGVDLAMSVGGELEYTPREAIVRSRAGDPWVELHLPRGGRPFEEARIKVQLLAPWGGGVRAYWVPVEGWIGGFGEEHAGEPETIDVGHDHLELVVRPGALAMRLRLDPPDWSQIRIDRVWVRSRPWSQWWWRWGPLGLVAVAGAFALGREAWRRGAKRAGTAAAEQRRERWLAVGVAAVAVGWKLWLVDVQPLQVWGHAVHDDALFVALAEHLRAGRWLGPYNEFTLIKGPMYPLWIAVSGALGIPLLLGQHVAYVLAAGLTTWALRPILRRPWVLAAVFLWLLFNPATFAAGEGTRVLRSNVATALALATFALWIGAVLRWRESPRALWRWTVPLGPVAGAFWLTREEGVWLLPALALPAGWLVWEWCREARRADGMRWSAKEWAGRIALFFAVPLAGWAGAVATVCALNWRHYGWWGVVEMREPGFRAAYGALLRCGVDSRHPMIPLMRAERERLHEVSPAFGELRPMFDGEIGEFWAHVSASDTGFAAQDREHSAVTLMWGLRAAAAAAGHHASARQAAAFYRRMAEEIDAAADAGWVPAAARPHRSLAPRWRRVWVSAVPARWVEAVWYLVRFDGWTARSAESWGTWESIERFKRMTHERVGAAPGPDGQMRPAPPVPARELRLQTLEHIRSVYRAVLPIAGTVGVVFGAKALLMAVRRRRVGAALSVALAAATGVAALTLIVSLIDVTAFPAVTLSYLSPAYPLALLVPVLAACAWRVARAEIGAGERRAEGWRAGLTEEAPLVAALLLAGAKLSLVTAQPLQAIGYAPHDDTLFLSLAEHLLAGRWLGPYDQFTLAKGPAYAVWIAGSHWLGVPLLFGQHLAYLAAAALVVWALRPLVPNPWVRLAIFAWLAWNPVTYSGADGTRVLRNGLAATMALATFGLALGAALRWRTAWPRWAAWSGASGVACGVFWLTREEGVWLLPALAVLLGAVAVSAWREARSGGSGTSATSRATAWGLRCAVWVAVPLAGWSAVVGTVCALNRAHYGWWGTVEFRAPQFVAAVGALQRVEHAAPRRHVPVPREVRERLYVASPAMAELRDYFEGPAGASWARLVAAGTGGTTDEPQEIPGAAFVWALREAVAAAGHHGSAPEALAFYRRLADEVHAAVDEGRVSGRSRRGGLLPPWGAEQTREFGPTLRRAVGTLLTLRGWVVRPRESAGTSEQLEWVQRLTRERLSPREGEVQRMRNEVHERALRRLEWVARRVYRGALPWVMGVGVAAWGVAVWRMVRAGRWPVGARGMAAAGAAAAAGSTVALCAIVAVVEIASFEAVMLSYLAPAVPVALSFPVLALAAVFGREEEGGR